MIAKLKGLIDSFGDDWVIVDVNGVGYLVTCSTRTLSSLPSKGEAVEIATETFVREDQLRLFGFATESERDWFRLLQSVQGIGTKVALAILSTLTASDLATAIAVQDKAMVSRAPGVGPKMAQRLLIELKDKVPAFAGGDEALAGLAGGIAASAGSPAADAVSALVNLGYQMTHASAAVARAVKSSGDDASTQTLIRLGLKELAG